MSFLQTLDAVLTECDRQDEKWGEQNHPDGTSAEYGEAAALQKACVDRLARDGGLTWAEILLEEIYEAYTETDPEKLVEELVQAIAVAWQWIEAIGRRPQPTILDELHILSLSPTMEPTMGVVEPESAREEAA